MRSFFLCLFFVLFSMTLAAQELNWKNINAENEPLARHENALVAVGNKIVLIGGRGEKPVDIYDAKEKTWSHGAQPPFEIHHMQAVSLDGLVYVLGGFTGSWPYETPLTHILIYDVTEDVWTIGSEIPQGRRRGAAGAVAHNDKIYLVKGIINGHTSGWVNWLDEYDPYTGEWKILADAPVARDHFQAAVINDKLFVAGGRRSGSAETGFSGTVKETNVYDFKSNTWETMADIPTPRAGTAAAVFRDTYVVIGGESDTQEVAHNEVESLDPNSGTWKKLTPLQTGRHGTQAISFQDKIILGAGSGNRGGGPELTSFEVLSASNNSDINFEELEVGNLVASKDSVTFGSGNSVQELILTNPGEKALVISYLQLNDAEGFQLNSDLTSPVIVGPGKNLKIEVSSSGSDINPSAKILIKTLGESEPLEVTLSR